MAKGLFKVDIDLNLCKRCGICVYICPKNVFHFRDHIIIKRDKCSGCGICEIICPDIAITLKKNDEGVGRR